MEKNKKNFFFAFFRDIHKTVVHQSGTVQLALAVPSDNNLCRE